MSQPAGRRGFAFAAVSLTGTLLVRALSKRLVSFKVERSNHRAIESVTDDLTSEDMRTRPKTSLLEKIGLTLTVVVPIIGALLAGAMSASAFIHGGVLSLAVGYTGLVVTFACLWVAYLAGCFVADW
jgi:hypothetical protein